MTQTSLRVGVLGTGRIVAGALMAPAAELDDVDVVAIASRDVVRAESAARGFGIARAHGSYEALLADESVDAVYVANASALHRPWTVAALSAGKHVLCEKPLASNTSDAKAIAVAAAKHPGLVAMEALHCDHHPIRGQVRGIIASGVLGDLVHVDATFAVAADRFAPDDIRWSFDLGGGAMMDLGVYCVSWLRWVRSELPTVTSAVATCPVTDVDGTLRAEVRFDDGLTASLRADMLDEDVRGHAARLVVRGTEATLHVENPLVPQGGTRMVVTGPSGEVAHTVSEESTYLCQLRAFRDAVLHGGPNVTPVVDGVARMQLIDACYRAAGLPERPRWPEDG